MASEGEANAARQQCRSDLLKKGVHSIGVEEMKIDGVTSWVVVAYLEPSENVSLPSFVSLNDENGRMEVPLIVARTKRLSPD